VCIRVTVGNEMTERYRRRSRTITILDASAHPQLFGQHFRDHVTWAAWCVFLCALFGLPLTSEQLALYTKYTGRTTPPTTPLHEAWLVCVGAPPVVTAIARLRVPVTGLSRRQRLPTQSVIASLAAVW